MAYRPAAESWAGPAGAVAGCVVATIVAIALGPAAAASGGGSSPARSAPAKAAGRSVRFASSGDHSEIRKRLPIADHKWGKKRVAMTAQLPTLHKGDVLKATGEVQLSIHQIGRQHVLAFLKGHIGTLCDIASDLPGIGRVSGRNDIAGDFVIFIISHNDIII